MKRAICIGVAVAAVTTAVLAQVGQTGAPAGRVARGGVEESRGRQESSPQADATAQSRKTLDAYCTGCHNSRARAGGVAFDTLNLDALHEHADVWEAAARKLRGRLMPPPGSRQPD